MQIFESQTELGNEKEDYAGPEGPYTDKRLADKNWLREYYQEIEEAERRKQNQENLFDGTEALET